MIRLLFAASLILPVTASAETFDEMWNRRIAEPLAEAHQLPVVVKTIAIKAEPKKVEVEPHRRHRHRR